MIDDEKTHNNHIHTPGNCILWMCKGCTGKKVLKPSDRKQGAEYLIEEKDVSTVEGFQDSWSDPINVVLPEQEG